jgi:pantoate--beta-alanine ligase
MAICRSVREKSRRADNTDYSKFYLCLVKRSLVENELTVVSIFVNPAQFAPHEDFGTYPRTLPHDLKLLSALEYQPTDFSDVLRTPSAVFVPSVKDMYPSGISQDVSQQRGTFVEVKGYSEQMEGHNRPTFFRGVATVVAKLFNIIQVRIVLR